MCCLAFSGVGKSVFQPKIMITNFYTKPLQGKLLGLFQNLILKLCEEHIRNMKNSEKLVKMDTRIENTDTMIVQNQSNQRRSVL